MNDNTNMKGLLFGIVAGSSVPLLSSCGTNAPQKPKMYKVEYQVKVKSSAQKIAIRYEDTPNFGVAISKTTLLTEIHPENMKRVVVSTKNLMDTPWKTTVELPEGALAYAVAGYEGGPKHENILVEIYVDDKFKAAGQVFNSDEMNSSHTIEPLQ